MAKLTMATPADFKPKKAVTIPPNEIDSALESRNSAKHGYSNDFVRQKLRISDFYPDEQFIKATFEHEYKDFILLLLPVIITAIFVIIHKGNFYMDLIKFFQSLM